jgi:molybdopterin-containing oxidoreductase family iron-sulfur binding subunit
MAQQLPKHDPLIRMQQDLRRSLAGKRPVRWGMVIDQSKCIGCHACTVACISENTLPPGVVYRPVIDTESGTFPHVSRTFLPRPCMQCGNPPCVKVCPVTATWLDKTNGVTVIDYERCIGCRACLKACPYGARTSDFGEKYPDGCPDLEGVLVGEKNAVVGYQLHTAAEYDKNWGERKGGRSPAGNARKCHFCLHRIKNGLLPACVTGCVGRATIFGDFNDPDSLASISAASPRAGKLKAHLGTNPQVIYLS